LWCVSDMSPGKIDLETGRFFGIYISYTQVGRAPLASGSQVIDWAQAASGRDSTSGGTMQETESEHRARLQELASKLSFTLKNDGQRFALYRDVDVPDPVRHDGLTLDEVQDILTTWKLRGPHGG
jgi:hypothetical protein